MAGGAGSRGAALPVLEKITNFSRKLLVFVGPKSLPGPRDEVIVKVADGVRASALAAIAMKRGPGSP